MGSWALFIALHVASVGFALLSIARLYAYIRKYKFDESKYTLLFGFVHLRWIAGLYLIFTLLWLPVSYFLFIRL